MDYALGVGQYRLWGAENLPSIFFYSFPHGVQRCGLIDGMGIVLK